MTEIDRVRELLEDPEIEALAVVSLYLDGIGEVEQVRFISYLVGRFLPGWHCVKEANVNIPNDEPFFRSRQNGVTKRKAHGQTRV